MPLKCIGNCGGPPARAQAGPPIVARTRMPNTGAALRDAARIHCFFFTGYPPSCDECGRNPASSLPENGCARPRRFQAEMSVEEAWRYAIILKGPIISLRRKDSALLQEPIKHVLAP